MNSLARTTPQQAARTLAVMLAGGGWDVRNLELDLGAGKVRIDLLRNDGLLAIFTGDSSKAQVETFRDEPIWDAKQRVEDVVERRFLGRTSFGPGARAGLRMFAGWLENNSPRPLLSETARMGFRALLNASAAASTGGGA